MKKKIMALILTFVMLLGLNTTVFANSTVPVTINGVEYNVTVPSSQMYTVPAGITNAENSNVITAADILLQAFVDKQNSTIASQVSAGSLVYGWDQSHLNLDGSAGFYVAKFDGDQGENTYYWLNSDTYQTDGYYRYRWVGSYWSLEINGEYADYYLSHYLANDVESIDFTFMQDEFTFNNPTPISGAIIPD